MGIRVVLSVLFSRILPRFPIGLAVLVRCRVLGTLLLICGAGGGSYPKRVMGNRRMVERFQLVARPYEIKTQNKEVQGY